MDGDWQNHLPVKRASVRAAEKRPRHRDAYLRTQFTLQLKGNRVRLQPIVLTYNLYICTIQIQYQTMRDISWKSSCKIDFNLGIFISKRMALCNDKPPGVVLTKWQNRPCYITKWRESKVVKCPTFLMFCKRILKNARLGVRNRPTSDLTALTRTQNL